MIEQIKEIILDFQEIELETGVPRRNRIIPMEGKATVCIGVRRGGKSTFLFQLMQKLIDRGVSRQNILYINFFDDRLHSLQRAGLDLVLEAYFSVYPEKKNVERVYFFFDEIQVVPNWEPFVDRLMRTENSEVYITGSSAKLLSREIATQMRGRALSWELFPFTFQEILDYKGIEIDKVHAISTKKRFLVQKAFEAYWESGGFPEVAGIDRHLRVKIHQEYFNAMLFRDLVERHDISHPKALFDLAHRLLDNVGSLYSINKLTAYLKTLGHKAPKSAVSEYIEWFEDAFFLFTVRLFDASLARSNANPKKIYCVDHAFVTSIASGVLVNSGHLLENLVFTSLRRSTENVFYYKTKSGREVDFIVRMPDRKRRLFQVCESLSDPKTRKREIKALGDAMAELKMTSSTIVTRNEEEKIHVASGKIDVVPAWRFLLRLSDTNDS